MNVRSLTSSPRFNRLMLWGGAVALAVGTTVFLIAAFGGGGKSATPLEPTETGRIALPPKPPKQAAFDTRARLVAGKFILTAVARKNLEDSWKLVHPTLKQGFTLKQWKKGDIPVTPFPVNALEQARFKVDQSYEKEVMLEVALIPNKGADMPATVFWLGLKKVGTGSGSQWLVDYWMPRWSAGLRSAGLK